MLLYSKPVQVNYWHFFEFSTPPACCKGKKQARLLVKTLLIDIILTLKVTINQLKRKKLCFWVFGRFIIRALTIRPRNMYIYVF